MRVHDDAEAEHLTHAVGAKAFTTGNDIFFGKGLLETSSQAGQELLGHELTHVVQQQDGRCSEPVAINEPGDAYERQAKRMAQAVAPRLAGGSSATPLDERSQEDIGGAPAWIQCYAIEPTSEAPAPPLTEAQIAAAIEYNEFRFKDPYTIAFIREVIGLDRFPAIADRDFALAIAEYQSHFGLPVDGQVGPRTTRALVRELRAEDERRLSELLRVDNYVAWGDVNAANRIDCGQFQWDVNWRTTLREGWLIQRVDSARHVEDCATGADATPAMTNHYWEAWWVDDTGHAWIPTTLATPPGTVAPDVADDRWRRRDFPGTRGNWSVAGAAYTALRLPVGFAIHGVPEAVDLPATVGPVNPDDVGLVEGSRRVGGQWDCCDPNPANHFHRPA